MATGTGKTICFSALVCDLFRSGLRTLILAHREELLQQTFDKLTTAAPWITPYAAITQGPRQDRQHPVVIASVQTLAQPHRTERYAPGHFGALIIDEAHHAPAPTYRRIIDALAPPRILGVTASARRGDAVGLDTVFEAVAYRYTLREAIEDGNLVDIRQLLVTTGTDLDSVTARRGDFNAQDLAKAVDTPERNRLVAETWITHGQGRKAIAFCTDVAHAENLAKAFQSFGVPAGWAYGDLAKNERRQVLADYRAGRLRVLCNCAILTEGFDDPPTSCVLMCRPTASLSLYEQMVGRGTRLHPGKADLLVIDYVDNCTKHRLAQAPDILGLPLDALGNEQTATEARKQWQDQAAKRQGREQAAEAAYLAQPLEYRLAQVDPWDPASVIHLGDYTPAAAPSKIDKAATDRQLAQLRLRGLPEPVLVTLTLGEASHLIEQIARFEQWTPSPRGSAQHLRRQINRYVGRAEAVYGLPEGTINRQALANFGTPRRAMTEEQLTKALAWTKARYPLPEELSP